MEDDRISLAHGNGGRFMRELIEEVFARHLGADELDVVVRQARVGTLTQSPMSVQAGSVSARYVAVADGLHSPLRRSLGLEGTRRGPARYGQRRHYARPMVVRPLSANISLPV